MTKESISFEPQESLSMKHVGVGDVIEDQYGNRLIVEEIITSKNNGTGIPNIINGRSIDTKVHISITFVGVASEQPTEDWRRWKIVSSRAN